MRRVKPRVYKSNGDWCVYPDTMKRPSADWWAAWYFVQRQNLLDRLGTFKPRIVKLKGRWYVMHAMPFKTNAQFHRAEAANTFAKRMAKLGI